MTGTTVSELWLIDSSAWLEYLTQDQDAAKFAPFIESGSPTLVPTIVLYEVVKVLMRQRGKIVADRFISEAPAPKSSSATRHPSDRYSAAVRRPIARSAGKWIGWRLAVASSGRR